MNSNSILDQQITKLISIILS